MIFIAQFLFAFFASLAFADWLKDRKKWQLAFTVFMALTTVWLFVLAIKRGAA